MPRTVPSRRPWAPEEVTERIQRGSPESAGSGTERQSWPLRLAANSLSGARSQRAPPLSSEDSDETSSPTGSEERSEGLPRTESERTTVLDKSPDQEPCDVRRKRREPAKRSSWTTGGVPIVRVAGRGFWVRSPADEELSAAVEKRTSRH